MRADAPLVIASVIAVALALASLALATAPIAAGDTAAWLLAGLSLALAAFAARVRNTLSTGALLFSLSALGLELVLRVLAR